MCRFADIIFENIDIFFQDATSINKMFKKKRHETNFEIIV